MSGSARNTVALNGIASCEPTTPMLPRTREPISSQIPSSKAPSIDQLIEDLWSGSGSVKSAQVAVARLRSSLGGAGSSGRLLTRRHEAAPYPQGGMA